MWLKLAKSRVSRSSVSPDGFVVTELLDDSPHDPLRTAVQPPQKRVGKVKKQRFVSNYSKPFHLKLPDGRLLKVGFLKNGWRVVNMKNDTKRKGFFKIIWRLLSIFIGLRATVPVPFIASKTGARSRGSIVGHTEASSHAAILAENLESNPDCNEEN